MNLSSIVSVILVLLTGYDSDLGEGIVVVDIYKAKEIKFFEAKDDKDPEHTIKLVNANREISIHPSTYERWLKPEDLWLDYSILNFRYIKQEGDWVEIVINKEIGLTKWINVNENVVSVPWHRFLVEYTTVVEPMESVPIKAGSSLEAETIRKSTDRDCFEALEIKGDWIKIRTSQGLDCSEHPEPIEAGWIRWVDGNSLLIKYFLTC